MYVLDDSIGRYLAKLVSVSCDPADLGCVLIRIQLGSLLALSFFDRLGTLGAVAVVPLGVRCAFKRVYFSRDANLAKVNIAPIILHWEHPLGLLSRRLLFWCGLAMYLSNRRTNKLLSQ
jgi:hypothetical protein